MVYFQWPIIGKFKVSKGISFSKHVVCLVGAIKSLWINIGRVQDYKLKKLSPPKNNKQMCVHAHRRFLATQIYVRHIFWKCEHVVFDLHFYLWKSVLKSWLGVIPSISRQTPSGGDLLLCIKKHRPWKSHLLSPHSFTAILLAQVLGQLQMSYFTGRMPASPVS